MSLSKSRVRNNNLIISLWLIIAILNILSLESYSQGVFPASPSNWLYPNGNMAATKYNRFPSLIGQSLDSIELKWSTNAIAGDVQPLIGNIINNSKIFDTFPFAQNEIAAIIGNDIIIVDAKGKSYIRRKPEDIKLLKGISVLLDTLNTDFSDGKTGMMVMGIETIENKSEDSLAFAYLAGFNTANQNSDYLKRMAIDMRRYSPNVYSSIKPVFARKNGDSLYIYATVNAGNPTVASGIYEPEQTPFLRGFVQFNSSNKLPNYPSYDIGDIAEQRLNFGPEINQFQPSIGDFSGRGGLLLPTYPTNNLNVTIKNTTLFETDANQPYSIGLNLSVNPADQLYDPFILNQFVTGSRPLIRSYHVKLRDGNLPEDNFVLVTEEYRGIDGSTGQSKVYLILEDGTPITLPNEPTNPPFKGSNNHLWSVGVGNLDGNSTNSWIDFYPNNLGNEIVLSQSTREFAFPESKLFVLRYNNNVINKPTPPGTTLFPFDTICTSKVNGWIAAINDIDRANDGKDEIVIVDGSTLRILRMRNYSDSRFKFGFPFDTVYTREFNKESISSAIVSDIDGDGRNDIIVTTYRATYVLGLPFQNALQVIEPVFASPKKDFCLEDTITISWKNLLSSNSKAEIYFQEFKDSIAFGRGIVRVGLPILVADSIDNSKDTVIYKLLIDSTFNGKMGIFAVANSSSRTSQFDTTTIVTFGSLSPKIDSIPNRKFSAGELLFLTGSSYCIDSLALEYQQDTSWVNFGSATISNDKFTTIVEIPCLKVFNINGKDIDSTLKFRFKAFKGRFSESSRTYSLPISPGKLPLKFDTIASAAPNKIIRWNKSDFKYTCDTIGVYISFDSLNFGLIDRIGTNNNEFYEWNVPTNIPDTVLLRVACENSCLRADTLISNLKAKYIKIVSPNPFTPQNEEVEVVYTVPSNVNVTIRIIDGNNNVVAEPVRNSPRNPNTIYTDRWNGLNFQGDYVSNGLYYLRIEMSNGIVEVYPVFVRK